MRTITVKEYLEQNTPSTLLDVRSPGEYAKGHFPAAKNLPLFSDEERAIVGTLYKQEGPEKAMVKGLEIAGRKMNEYVSLAQKLVKGKSAVVHCWRGGKRSESIATLLQFVGFDVSVVKGGYKAYRTFVLDGFYKKKLNLVTLGGRTGSGKTDVLAHLSEMGEQVIDLEGLANHKGSAFGALGQPAQPTVEQFENHLFEQFRQLDVSRRVWVENESQAIGKVFVPQGFWEQMTHSVLVEMEVPMGVRVERLIGDYGHFPKEELSASLQKISKRMGGQNVKAALEAFAEGDLETPTRLSLGYYDKAYDYGTAKKDFSQRHHLKFDSADCRKIAGKLIQFANEHDL